MVPGSGLCGLLRLDHLFGQVLGDGEGALDPLGVRGPVALDHHLVAADLRRALLALQEVDETRRVREAVAVELHRRALRPRVHLRDVGALRHRLDPHHQQQGVHLARKLPEAVDQLGGKALELDLRRQAREPAVEAEPDVEIGDEAFGDHHRHAEVDLRRPFAVALGLGQLARFQPRDGFLEHRLIELVADFPDMARLFFAQKVAGAAQVEILACQGEARAEIVERAQQPQPLHRLRRQRQARLRRQVAIGAQLRAPDPAADLVELGEAEHVGTVDDHRVRGRDVEAALDDGRRQQHVILAVVEGVHPRVELARRHLAMRGDEADLRHMGTQELLDLGQVGDARHDVEALAAAEALAQERLAHGDRVELADIGADRQAVDRRRADHAQIAHAGQAELQRARDRRCGEGEHMDFRAHFLQAFLVVHTEMLLLVDHQQAEVAEFHRLGQHRMGADDDVDGAIGQPLAGLRGVFRRDETAERADLECGAAEALGEGLVMLAGKQRRRRDHRHLHARGRGDEGRAHRHLGLAEAHVADHQPVHRPARLQVLDHVVDGVQLVLGLAVGEACGEGLPFVMRRLEDRCVAQHPFRRDPHQPVGDLPDAFLQPGLLRLPGAAAELVEKPVLVAIAAEQLDVGDGDVKPIAARIFQKHAVERRAKRGDGLEPLVAADAMIDMHDKIARRQALRLGQEILGLASLLRPADEPVAEHVLLGDHGEPLGLEARVERPDRKAEARDLAPVADEGRAAEPLVLEKPLQTLARALGPAGQNHRALLQPVFDMPFQGPEQADVLKLALGREIAPDAGAGVQDAGAGWRRQHLQLQHPVCCQNRFPGGFVEIKKPRRRRLVDGVDPVAPGHRLAPRVVLIGDPLPPRDPRRLDLVVEHHARLGQIVEEGLEPVVEEAEPMLHAGVLAPGRDRFVQRIVRAARAEFDAVVLPETGDRGLVEDHLAHRGKLDRLQLFGGALADRIEAARAVEHVAEEVEPHRPRLARRVDVDDAAAHRVIAGLGHGGDGREAHPHQERTQLFLAHRAADAGGEARGGDKRAGGDALHRGVECREQHEGPGNTGGERRKRRHPRGRDLGIGRDPVIGQTIPGREGQHHRLGREEGERGAHRLEPAIVAGDMDHRTAAGQLLRDQLRIIALGGTGQQKMFHASGGIRPVRGVKSPAGLSPRNSG
ncbi:hypothetical protein SDC9_19486 [bioreactor metagenome]|uniref:Uncharacterized protein n=1 Tax=bioreactor metagenome TaxID=1076179 RepID=A0A644U3I8_9ZZZZ